MPRWAVTMLRLLGGVSSGWLALLLFSGGGGGLGGPGGTHVGGNGENAAVSAKEKSHTSQRIVDSTHAVETLEVEVLGEATLKKIEPGLDLSHRYRIRTNDGPKLLTLKETETFIKERGSQAPVLEAVRIVLYDDSPDKTVKRVSDLSDWVCTLRVAGSERLLVPSYDQKSEKAPLK